MSSSHDTKGNIRARAFLSFVLFIMISLLSLSICAKAVFTEPAFIEKKLTSFTYVFSYRQDLINYTSDIFAKNGISCDNVEEIISYDTAEEIAVSYINSVIKARVGYTAQTVDTAIQTLEAAIGDEIKAGLVNTSYEYNEPTAQTIASYIGDYALERISIPHANYLEAVTNVGSPATLIICIVLAVFSAVLALITFFVGAKRYRSVRAISLSFMTAGIFDLFLSLIAIIIMNIKNINIYPNYLRTALMDYIFGSIDAVAIAGGILFLISLIFVTVVWKMKRDE